LGRAAPPVRFQGLQTPGDRGAHGRASTDKLLKNHGCRRSRHNGGHGPSFALILLMCFRPKHSLRRGADRNLKEDDYQLLRGRRSPRGSAYRNSFGSSSTTLMPVARPKAVGMGSAGPLARRPGLWAVLLTRSPASTHQRPHGEFNGVQVPALIQISSFRSDGGMNSQPRQIAPNSLELRPNPARRI
jgi:hypothetical protein